MQPATDQIPPPPLNINSCGNNRQKRSTFSTSAAAEIIGDNDDLLMEILVKLPPIALIRSQLVSKHWKSVISSPSFSRYHYSRHKSSSHQPPSFILQTRSSQFIYLNNSSTKLYFPLSNFKYSSTGTKIGILQSMHGLLLIESRNFKNGINDFYVYNPMTGRSRNLLLENSRVGYGEVMSRLCFISDPPSSTSSSAAHYKIGCVRMCSIEYKCRFELYDSETHTWNNGSGYPAFTLPREFMKFFRLNFSMAIHFNKRMYWVGPVSDVTGIPYLTPHIVETVCLDLEKGIISTPKNLNPWSSKGRGICKTYVMEVNGHLHCVSMYLGLMNREISLLVFEISDDNTEWVKKYSADLSSIPISVDAQPSVVGISRGKSEEESLVWILGLGKIISYRFSDKKFDVIELTREYGLLGFEGYASQIIESLAPV